MDRFLRQRRLLNSEIVIRRSRTASGKILERIRFNTMVWVFNFKGIAIIILKKVALLRNLHLIRKLLYYSLLLNPVVASGRITPLVLGLFILAGKTVRLRYRAKPCGRVRLR